MEKIIFLFMLILTNISFAQLIPPIPPEFIYDGQTEPLHSDYAPESTNCLYQSMLFSNINYWSPTELTPIKTIRLNFIFLHQDDGTGNFFSDINEYNEHEQFFNDVLAHLNNLYSNINTNIQGCPPTYSDTRIRFEITNKIHISNSYYWNNFFIYRSYKKK